MATFAEVFVIAATSQLAVLPGEKVQFIISGLSTRYSPYMVVAAAGSAFAGWTALEILLGEALQKALPKVALDTLAAAFFLLFAVLLVRSAPEDGDIPAETDGSGVAAAERDMSVFGFELPDEVSTFLGIFGMMAVGEFGDKTQLVTITLATQYTAGAAIWAGEMVAIIPVSLANALLFHRFSHRFNVRKAHYVGASIFLFFAADTVLQIVADVSVWGSVVEFVSSAVLTLV